MIYLSPPPECYSVVSFQTLIEITTSYGFPDIGEIFRFIKKIKEKKRKNISHCPHSFSSKHPYLLHVCMGRTIEFYVSVVH